MNLRRIVAATLLSAVAVVVTATPAFAHAELISSNPAQGATLAAPPQQVQLTFEEAVTPAADTIAVTGADGSSWQIGQVSIAGAVVTAPVVPSGPAGPYTLTYKVVSDDGDDVTGTIAFTLSVPATTTTTTAAPTTTTATTAATAAPASDSSGGVPVWVWILGAAVVIAVGVAIGVRATRSR